MGAAAYLEVTGDNPPPLLSLGGAAEVFGGRLRLTRAGAPALRATTSGWEDRLQPTLHDSAMRPTTRHGSGSAVLSLPPGIAIVSMAMVVIAMVSVAIVVV